ncbi:MAG: fructose-1,6-bisphosphate aldolase/phosphatase [Chloroflexi bacterium]|nr:fructose-1,6-bisphosphate aldolase/phosphatase [Chloroflexota bacterium]
MPQTLSVIKADVGGFVGHSAMHPEVLGAAAESLERAVQSGLLIDAQAHACGDDVFLVMSHDRGENDEGVHQLAWDTFIGGTEVARRLHLYGAGQDLLVDAFSGNIRGAGPGSAELELEERPSEPVLVFLGDKTSAGAFNLPLYKMFADPFNTAGLVISESLHEGFSFEVHDVREHRKIVFAAPGEIYDLLAFIGSPARYAVKRVASRATGEVAAVSSTDKLSEIAGRYVGKDDPTAIVRCQGAFPAVGEALEPFTTAWAVEGFMRGSHYGPWMPTSLGDAHPARFDGPPRLVALGFQLAEGKLVGPRDMFDDPSFENVRQEANDISDYLRKHGPFEPHRLPLDEMEYTTMPAVAAKLADRWSPL